MPMCSSQVLLGLESSVRAWSRNQRSLADVYESSPVGDCKCERYVQYISTDEHNQSICEPKNDHTQKKLEIPMNFLSDAGSKIVDEVGEITGSGQKQFTYRDDRKCYESESND